MSPHNKSLFLEDQNIILIMTPDLTLRLYNFFHAQLS